MVKGRPASILLVIVLSLGSVTNAQKASKSEKLFSPLTAGTFHKTAQRLYTSNPDRRDAAEQAMIFLNAAMELDPRAEYLYEDVLILGSQSTGDEGFDLVYRILRRYVNDRSDFEVLRKAVRYLLSTADSRQEREQLLMRFFFVVRKANSALASELATELAQLALEKGDVETAKANFAEAYGYNKYNRLAFERYHELLSKEGMALSAGAYARDLRLAMEIDPLDIDRAFVFADYCENIGLYDVAADAYEYTAGLFSHISPDRRLSASIYLPWSMTSHSTPMLAARCMKIANMVRQSGRFDIRIEALAGSAARKMGDAELSKQILDAAGRKAEDLLRSTGATAEVTAVELGWFYAFAQPNNERALAWANRAFTADPNAPGVKSMFGYALAVNDQFELAETYAADIANDQIAALTRAIIHLSRNEKNKAIETLKTAVAMDPLSLAAEKAKVLLIANGSEYIPRTSPAIVRDELKQEFGERIVPIFRPAKNILSVKLTVGGSDFSYGGDMNGQLIIANDSSSTIVVADDGMFTGNIRIDADVRGDINRKFPELIVKKVTPASPVEAGGYVSIPLDMMTGPLRNLLLAFPQASLEIDFTAYLDPVVDSTGTVRNSLKDIPPISNTVKRRGVDLTRQYLIQRLEALASGHEGQKIRAAQLFAGLLVEQDFMSKSRPLYRYINVERPILVDSVRRSLADRNWKVRLHAIEALTLYNGKPDFQITNALSDSLNDSHWPVRMMTLYLLSRTQTDDFGRVLDWSAKYDSEPMVRSMAVALGGAPATTSAGN